MNNLQTSRETETEIAGTSKFVEDSSTRQTSRSNVPESQHALGVETFKSPTIAEFFRRPVLILTGTWNSTDAANTQITSFDIGSTMLAEPLWSEKLAGFRNVRGTAVIKLQINAQPFQQGRLLLHFLPCRKEIDNATTLQYSKAHNFSLIQKTQQPNVECDCRDAASTLELPYSTPSQWFDVKDGMYDWGTVYLSVLSPLTSAAATDLEFSLWMYFKDFEVAAPYYNQMCLPYAEQMARPSGSRVSKDEDDVSDRPISSVLSTVASVANTAKGVPLLSSIAEPVYWASNLASNVASVLGFSKPLSTDPGSYYVERPFRNMTNSEGAPNAESLSMAVKGLVSRTSGVSGTDEDELNLKYICSIPSYSESFTWSTAHAKDTSRKGAFIGPQLSIMRQSTTHTTAVTNHVYNYTPAGFVASNYNLYRGSIEITFKVIKTEYHSGRLLFVFNPGDVVSTTPNNSQTQYIYRDILDIRNGSEITLRFPYLINTPYISTTKAIGYVDVRVLNELRAPSTVSSSVEVLMFVRGGPDFEVAVPASNSHLPFSPQMANPVGLNGDEELTDGGIGGSTEMDLDTIHSEQCIGDYATTFKQLLMRASRVYSDATYELSTDYSFRFYPFFCGFAQSGSIGPTYSGSPMARDAQSKIMSGYAFSRGSMGYIYHNYADSGANIYTSVSLLSSNASSATTGVNADLVYTTPSWAGEGNASSIGNNFSAEGDNAGTNAVVLYMGTQQGVQFNCPQYECSPMRLNIPMITNSVFNATPHNNWRIYPKTNVQVYSASNPTKARLYRFAGDDFTCHYFIGFPPILHSMS